MPEQAYKVCGSCGEEKTIDGFHRNRSSKDGRSSSCKECARERARAWREANRERVRETWDRFEEQHPDRVLEAKKRYVENHPEQRRESVRRSRAKYPDKARAWSVLNNALERGRAEKPTNCEDCGGEPHLLHGHHHDYSKPLEVEWLCPPCHERRHHAV